MTKKEKRERVGDEALCEASLAKGKTSKAGKNTFKKSINHSLS